MVSAMMEMAEKRLSQLNKRQRVTCPASDLVVGVQCGGSDAFSGVTANPAVGYAADLIVRAGGIATGEASIADVGWELFHLILDVASARKQVAADRLGLHNALVLFNPAPVT